MTILVWNCHRGALNIVKLPLQRAALPLYSGYIDVSGRRVIPIMDENQSDLTLPDISEAEHLATNDENDHENGDQVKFRILL